MPGTIPEAHPWLAQFPEARRPYITAWFAYACAGRPDT